MATFVLHQALVHYVLAGSLLVAGATLFPGCGPVQRADQPLAATLRDWMPFALSAAITAGIAPLLFVQIVYPESFYTANLLLGWRWMIVIPALIAAFYLLYLVKSSAIFRWPYPVRAAIVLGIAGLFVFVGFCWTANHLIGNDRSSWPGIYATQSAPLPAATVGTRMLVWIGGAFATLAMIAGWQLAGQRAAASEELRPLLALEMRRLALLAIVGLMIAGAAGGAYLAQAEPEVREAALGALGFPYAIAAVIGALVQLAAWAGMWRIGMCRWLLAGATLGCLLCLASVSVLREGIRLTAIEIDALYPHHAAAAKIGGLGVFLLFAVVNAALIAGCIRLVRRGLAGRE